MVVDDEMTNRRLCQRMLQRLECSCVCLEDGDEILGKLLADGYVVSQSGPRSGAVDTSGAAGPPAGDGDIVHRVCQQFDIILLDIMMRRSNGVDVLVDLKKRFEGSSTELPPVVAMTGNTSLQDLATYKQVGFVHVLGKPFDMDGLKSTLMMFDPRR